MKLSILSTIFTVFLGAVFTAYSISMIRSTDLLESESRDMDQAARNLSAAQGLKSRILIHNRNEFLGTVYNDRVRLGKNHIYVDEINKLLEILDQLVMSETEKTALIEVRNHIADIFESKKELKSTHTSPVQDYELVNRKSTLPSLVLIN